MSNLQTPFASPEQAEEASRERMREMIRGFQTTQIVHAIAHFAIADRLAEGPATAEEIAAACNTDPDATFRLLRACASLGLVVADSQLRFTTTPMLDTLRRGAPGFLRDIAMMYASRGLWAPWGNLVEAVQTGSQQAIATLGSDLWAYYQKNPEEAAGFSASMSGWTAIVSKEVVETVDTRSFELAADIGGSGGALLHALMAADPRLNGILFDLPEVVANAMQAPLWRGMHERVAVVAGNFLSSVPAADLYLLKYILHNWDSSSCVRILQNCRRSLRPNGRVVVIERQFGKIDAPAPGVLVDLTMLVLLPGARERSVSEYEELYSAAGLRLVSVAPTRSGTSIMQAVAQ